MRSARSSDAAAFVSRPAAISARALVTRLAMAAAPVVVGAGTGAGRAATGPGTESGSGAAPESGRGAGTESGIGAGGEGSDTGAGGCTVAQPPRISAAARMYLVMPY